MAQSPAHKFGQIIGNCLEGSIEPLLREFSQKHGLYLDKTGYRPARRGKKVSWKDHFGNTHDLDYVLERGGTADRFGVPTAFIETAWRRYTKHSRNKSQEIQGAILPLAETYQNAAPFRGVVLAGVYTNGALDQLRSLGFITLYLPYETIIKAFSYVGIDAEYDENTPEHEFEDKIKTWENLSEDQRILVSKKLIEINQNEVKSFFRLLERTVTRQIESVHVLPLHGTMFELTSVENAIDFIEKYDEDDGSKRIIKYDVYIYYSNGDQIKGSFSDKESAIEFLGKYLYPELHPS